MKNKTVKNIILSLVVIFTVTSCAKKLDLIPVNDLTPATTFANASGYKSVLAKIYGTLSITGNTGPSGNPDISGGLDEGSQVAFIRMLFNCEELPTDEAVVAWNDQTIHDFHDLKWTADDPFLKGIYARPIYNITLINEYLRESTDAKLTERNITGSDAADIKKSRAETRFLRAFNYWVMLELFGKSTFITEANLIGTDLPGEIDRASLFNYITGELKSIDADLAPVKTIEYGRVDQGAEWALMARMYLNANVYLGNSATTYYDSAITYSQKVINAGYALNSTAVNGYSGYSQLFMADNDKRTNEIVWAINCDGAHTQAYGNTTFFVHCASGADHDDFGVAGGWNGYRATAALAALFPDLTGATDKRAMFITSSYGVGPSQLVINDVSNFDQGMHVVKYKNIRSDNAPVNDPTRTFSDVDFPVFRLSEMYLIYAESVLRGGVGGNAAQALIYLNLVRARAGASLFTASDFLPAATTGLQNILKERGRELYWEGHRRTDLIRYGLLTTGTYLWPWKGGVASGTAVNGKYNIFPIPQTNRTSNPNLTQNSGY